MNTDFVSILLGAFSSFSGDCRLVLQRARRHRCHQGRAPLTAGTHRRPRLHCRRQGQGGGTLLPQDAEVDLEGQVSDARRTSTHRPEGEIATLATGETDRQIATDKHKQRETDTAHRQTRIHTNIRAQTMTERNRHVHIL